jgi:hypothetical protein
MDYGFEPNAFQAMRTRQTRVDARKDCKREMGGKLAESQPLRKLTVLCLDAASCSQCHRGVDTGKCVSLKILFPNSKCETVPTRRTVGYERASQCAVSAPPFPCGSLHALMIIYGSISIASHCFCISLIVSLTPIAVGMLLVLKYTLISSFEPHAELSR